MLGFELLVLFAKRDGLGSLHEAARALGELFHIHDGPLMSVQRLAPVTGEPCAFSAVELGVAS